MPLLRIKPAFISIIVILAPTHSMKMSRRIEQLTAAQAIELLGSLSDQSDSEDDLSSESDGE